MADTMPERRVSSTIVTRDKGESNLIEGESNAQITKRVTVTFGGSNNELIIGKAVRFVDVSIFFDGDDSVIEFEGNCKINGRFIVKSRSLIKIGSGTKFNSNEARLHCGEPETKIIVGRKCLFASVRCRTSDQHGIYDIETDKRLNNPADIILEDRVWIAENVYIYKGVTIGSGSVVGARSTVTNSLPSDSLCVGTPARAVKSGIYWRDRIIGT